MDAPVLLYGDFRLSVSNSKLISFVVSVQTENLFRHSEKGSFLNCSKAC